MAHKNTYVLERLLEQLDYENNDIYIHVDYKCTDFDWTKYKKIVSKSQLFEIKKRIDVSWGSYSQIEAEMELLTESYFNRNYRYYHLMSGQDLALKPQREIHNFFEANDGSIYLNMVEVSEANRVDWNFSNTVYGRVSVKRIFLDRASLSSNIGRKILGLVDRFYAYIQAKFLMRDLVRSKNICLGYGSNWFSLPENAVKCVLDNRHKIEYYFKDSRCADELFIQSILKENKLTVVNDNLRMIDWKRGDNAHPYVWHKEDLTQLSKTEKLFARKFDENIDKEIINKISDMVLRK